MKQQLFDVMEQAYCAAGLLDQTPQREGGLAVLQALLKSVQGTVSAAGVPGCSCAHRCSEVACQGEGCCLRHSSQQ